MIDGEWSQIGTKSSGAFCAIKFSPETERVVDKVLVSIVDEVLVRCSSERTGAERSEFLEVSKFVGDLVSLVEQDAPTELPSIETTTAAAARGRTPSSRTAAISENVLLEDFLKTISASGELVEAVSEIGADPTGLPDGGSSLARLSNVSDAMRASIAF